jgi:hypothetical protein
MCPIERTVRGAANMHKSNRLAGENENKNDDTHSTNTILAALRELVSNREHHIRAREKSSAYHTPAQQNQATPQLIRDM